MKIKGKFASSENIEEKEAYCGKKVHIVFILICRNIYILFSIRNRK